MDHTVGDIPFQLGASDIVKHILSIDSRFRENPTLTSSSSSDFFFRLLSPVKNVLRIRITSIEIPNNYYIFSVGRKNVTIAIVKGDVKTLITVSPGNYAADQMEDALNEAFTAAGLTWLSVTFKEVTGQFTFNGGANAFSIITDVSGSVWPRPFDYGLGYNLGFTRGTFPSALVGSAQKVTSTYCANFAGDPYIFLKINEFDCVRQTVAGSDFRALAKIVMKDAKNYMNFDDYASQHAKEVTFPIPQDLNRFHIQLLDPYGEPLHMTDTHFSFSIEVLEIRKLSLYNTIRDAFTVGWISPPSSGLKEV